MAVNLVTVVLELASWEPAYPHPRRSVPAADL